MKDMKNLSYALLALLFVLQSCSHIVMYQESDFQNNDSPYPARPMRFAYHANGQSLSPSLLGIGNKIHQISSTDTQYQVVLQSAEDEEKRVNQVGVMHDNYRSKCSECEGYLESSKKSENHNEVISMLTSLNSDLSQYKGVDFRDFWKKAFQLSHRGIFQHYLNSDFECKDLNLTDKALVYGYILKKDITECDRLANMQAQADIDAINGIESKINKEISRRKSILEQIEQRKKAEAEKLRKQREAELRARLEREAREQAQLRWSDPNCSWIDGHWFYNFGSSSVNIYIDTDRHTLKKYTSKLFDLRPILEYSGRYTIEDGRDQYKGYKVIFFGDTYVLADPDTGRLCDDLGKPFEKKR